MQEMKNLKLTPVKGKSETFFLSQINKLCSLDLKIINKQTEIP